MRAVDTNVLVFAEVRSGPHHQTALRLLRDLAEGAAPWAIPWPCAYEFLRVVTHPRIFHPPVPMDRALRDLDRVMSSPSLHLLHETRRHRGFLNEVIRSSGATGNLVHDAHIAALCLEHGVTEFITGDRDFARFGRLTVHDPFDA